MPRPAAERTARRPVAFITGASSGLGQALARRYVQAGWRVALVARRLIELEDWVRGQGWPDDRWRAYAADVREAAQLRTAAEACLREWGVPDVVVANAGISVGIDLAYAEDLSVLQDLLATNVLGLAATFQPFIDPMKAQRRGTLVGIASVAAMRGLPGHAGYCASKAAVVQVCETLRGELRPFGVKVVTLAPGYIDTPLTRENDYPMPFLMSADAFAEQACRAISAGVRFRVIPWPMGVVATVLKFMPRALFDALVGAQSHRKKRRRQ